MEFINKVLTKLYKQKYVLNVTIVFIILFMLYCVILSALKIEGSLAFIIFIIIIIGYIVCRYYYTKIYNYEKIDFNKTKFYKELLKTCNIDEFIKSINSEIKSKNSLKHYEDIHNVGIIITENWFVFISRNNPIIRKTSEILKISKEFSISDSRPHFFVEFKDNTYFSTRKINYDEVADKIKNIIN